MENLNLDWMDKQIPSIPGSRWVYKAMCLFLFRRTRKLTYKELYVIIFHVNEKIIGEDRARSVALNEILSIYKELNNNELPNGIK